MTGSNETQNSMDEQNTTAPESPEVNESQETQEAPRSEEPRISQVFSFVNPNVTMTKSPLKDQISKKQIDAQPLVSFGMSLTNLKNIQIPNVQLLRTAADPKWASDYGQTYVDQISNIFLDTEPDIQVERAMITGKWSQHIEYQGYKMQPDAPRIEPATTGDKLTGTAAMSQMNMLLGGGKYIRVPLYASGFWVTLTVPNNNELLNLNMNLEEKKGQVGRATAGAIFSNRQALMVEDIFSFVLEHIYDTTIKNWTEIDLAKHIKTVDLYPLIHAMSTCIFPDGFKYHIPCVTNPVECNYVKEATLNLGKMFWTDNDKLNVHQMKFMYDSLTKHRTLDEVTRYQDDMRLTTNNKVEINEKVTAVLRLGTVSDLIESGNRWISDVAKTVDKLAFSKATEEQRQYLLHSHMTITSIREYSHYIERFILTPDENTNQYIDDENAIEAAIGTIAADNDHAESFTKGVAEFIERNIVTVIGTPNFECPQCHKSQTQESSIHPLICAFDPLVVFTILMGRRLSLIGK